MLSLNRLETLPDPFITNQQPSFNMVRSSRLYTCSAEDVPENPHSESLRDLYKILVENKSYAFVSEDKVFVTSKRVQQPRDMKKVAVEDLIPSFKIPVVRCGIADFLLNEVFPTVSPCSAQRWSTNFLIDFDRLLSIEVENQGTSDMMKTYNFRNLHHRICTRFMDKSEIEHTRAKLPHYSTLLDLFQS